MNVSILIISYNTRELTLACLRSVYAQTTGVSFEVIVVDNLSHDGSGDAIRARFPQVRLLEPGKNLGFAGANNLAAREARGDYLLLLNPDTVILDGAIQKVVEFARLHPAAQVYGGRTFFGDMTLNRNSCHGAPTPWSLFCMGIGLSSLFRRSALFNPESLGAWQRDSVRQVDVVTGCFLLIRNDLWKQLRGFDESFFMYGEDTDLCVRARQAGATCLICPDARLIHYGGQSERIRADKMIRLFRAKTQFFQKHWPPSQVRFGVAMLKTWALSRMLATKMISIVRPNCCTAHQSWREIWRRRTEYDVASASAGRGGLVREGESSIRSLPPAS